MAEKVRSLREPNIELSLLMDTPEKAVAAFVNAWESNRLDLMYIACTCTWKHSETEAGNRNKLLGWFGRKVIESGRVTLELLKPEPGATPIVADFRVPVTYRMRDADGQPTGEANRVYVLLRVIREMKPYQPYSGEGSYWGVNPVSALREESIPNE